MPQPKIYELVQAGRKLLSRNICDSQSYKKKPLFKLPLRIKQRPHSNSNEVNPIHTFIKKLASAKSRLPLKLPLKMKQPYHATSPVVNPINKLFRGLSSTLSQITKRPVEEDFDAIAKSFLPQNARLLLPQNPANSREIQLADLDGDSSKAIITSFMHNDRIQTIILKKQSEQWVKVAEISNSDYDQLNYRGVADITGEGKRQLLIGLTSGDKDSTLYGYSLENDTVNELFSHNYSRFSVLHSTNNRSMNTKAQLAIWSKKDNDGYNIEVLRWNGLQLEPLKSVAPYYYRSVVPHYLGKISKTPNAPSNWYNLAEALEKAGARSDALVAVEFGMRQDHNSEFKEDFLVLRNKITGK